DDSGDTGPKRTFCLDGTDGALLWNYYLGGPGFSVMAIEDVNGDDVPDVFTGASNENETEGLVVCINGASGSAFWSETVTGSSVWGLVQLDDINGDGVKDVAAGDFQGHFYAYDAVNGDDLFSGSIGGSPLILRLERLDDVNSDGYADILFGSSSSNCIVVSGFDGSNIWLTSLMDKAWNVDRIDDINGDGINDVLVGTLFSSNYVYFIDGVTGEDLKSINYGEAVDAISAIPDINGDGSMEMVAGGRNGKVVCYSGGLNASTIIEQPEHSQLKMDIECNPNPFVWETNITISSTQRVNANIRIFSAGGRLMHDFGAFSIDANKINLTWNGTGIKGLEVMPGLYFLVVTDGLHSKTMKLVKN
nr:T9SS type A sorting domain-containing protein [Bacteroidota bacterium]